MTGHQGYRLLEAIKYSLRSFKTIEIILDSEESSRISKTKRTPDGKFTVRLGVNKLKYNFENVSNEKVTEHVVKLLHEVCGHCGQELYELTKDTPLTRILGLNLVACRSSGYYYYGPEYKDDEDENEDEDTVDRNNNANDDDDTYTTYTGDYARQPIELAAQYMGFKAARNYLSVAYGRKTADDMLMGYAAAAINQGIGFLQWPDVWAARKLRLKELENNGLSRLAVRADGSVDSGSKPNIDDVLYAFDKKI